MKHQLCFKVADEEHNNMVIEKLKKFKSTLKDGDTVHSCHLNRKILIEKNFDMKILDSLEEIFGDSYYNHCTASEFAVAMKEMDDYRKQVAGLVDSIVVIGAQSISNIALEIELFTQNRVRFFQ